MNNYTISTMTRSEVEIAINWAAKEGWNPGVSDAECFYQTDPNGFFAGKLNGEIIAVGSAIRYDDNFGFCGFYIVAPKYRGKGYGMLLTKARLAYLDGLNVGIDGVLEMQEKYQKIGYKLSHKNIRYQKRGPLSGDQDADDSIVDLQTIDFDQLCEYDGRYFPAPRRTFLSHWIKHHQGAALGFFEEGIIKGYGVIRLCREGFKIGPLFADNSVIAEKLLTSLSHYAKDEHFYLDIPQGNPYAKELVAKHHFKKVFETGRMYLGSDPKLPLKNIYGITTFELG